MATPSKILSKRPPRVQMTAIKRSFGHIEALKHVDLHVDAGEVVALLGDNGAGKSTLMKILSGADKPTSGGISIDGQPVDFASPKAARQAGIEMIYQDLALCDDLDVASNFYMGAEPRRLGFLDRRKMHSNAAKELHALGSKIPSTHVEIRSLSGGQRQTVAIGRALLFSPKVLIMDEPTAALGVREAKAVLDTIKAIKGKDVGIIIISHRLQDILDVCDRVVVISGGRNSDNFPVEGMAIQDLALRISA